MLLSRLGLWAGAAALALSACSVNRPWPAEGFPELQERLHVLEPKDMRDVCAAYVPPVWRALGGVPYACVYADLCAGTCDIWISELTIGGLAHERGHCLGHDHWFETSMRDALERARRVCPQRLNGVSPNPASAGLSTTRRSIP